MFTEKNEKSLIGPNDHGRHFFAWGRGLEDFGGVGGCSGSSIFVRFLFGCSSVSYRTEQLRYWPNRTFYRTEHGKKLPNRTAPEPNKSGQKNAEPNRTSRFGRPLVSATRLRPILCPVTFWEPILSSYLSLEIANSPFFLTLTNEDN